MQYDKAGNYREVVELLIDQRGEPGRHGSSQAATPRSLGKVAAKLVRLSDAEESTRPADISPESVTLELRTEIAAVGQLAKWRGKSYRVATANLVGPFRQSVLLVPK